MTHRCGRALALLLLSLCFLPQLFSCVPAWDTGVPAPYITFADDAGVTVSLPQKPQRVAVLFSSFADIWKSAGGTVAITVGESVERGFAASDAILVDGGAGKTINTELLIAEAPDLVICSADIEAQAETARLLVDNGIPAACFRVESFEDYLRVLKICTDVTQRPDLYEKNGVRVKERIDSLLDAVKEKKETERFLFVRASATSVKAKSSQDHFASAMLSELGAVNLADKLPILIDGLSGEIILQENPTHVFVSVMGNEESAKARLDSDTVLSSLDAVKEGRCHILPKDLFQYKPNSRWDEAYLYLIKLLYEDFEATIS